MRFFPLQIHYVTLRGTPHVGSPLSKASAFEIHLSCIFLHDKGIPTSAEVGLGLCPKYPQAFKKA